MMSELNTGAISKIRPDHSTWMDSLAEYLTGTEAKCLNLSSLNIRTEELKSVLELICDSKVTELILANNKLEGLNDLSQLLIKTKIKKLNVRNCDLSFNDIWYLMDVCAEMQLTSFKLNGNKDFDMVEEETLNKVISFMLRCPNTLCDSFYTFMSHSERFSLLHILPHVSLTCLDLSYDSIKEDALISVFSNLPCMSITALNLTNVFFELGGSCSDAFLELAKNLRLTKLLKLTLAANKIDDKGVDILMEGLIHSSITHLDLSANIFQGLNTLGFHLKDTCIKSLSLNSNECLIYHGIFLSPSFLRTSSIVSLGMQNCKLNDTFYLKLFESLKFSKVTFLDITENNLQLPMIIKFAEVLKDTDLNEVDFSRNNLSLEALTIFAGGIKASKLKKLTLCRNCKGPYGGSLLSVFLKKMEIRKCTLATVKNAQNNIWRPKTISSTENSDNTVLDYLDISCNELGIGVLNLVENLRFTSLTVLYLFDSQLTDEGVEALARILKDTQLIELRLTQNKITCHGAKALALSLKDSSLLRLRLWRNEIKDDGMEALARGAENTFLTVLDLSHNPGDRQLFVDSVLWRNKLSVHQFRNVFKQVAPRANDNKFCFDRDLRNQDVNTFLGNCLQLYKTFCEKPSAVSIILEAKIVSLSREEIVFIMSEEFPNQFSFFVANSIEFDTQQHVNLLERAESMGLKKIVELLLLNRPLYCIDECLEILHPYVYKLLSKYNYPLYNLDIEPDGRFKIIDYFSEHGEIEGASDAIRILRGKRKN